MMKKSLIAFLLLIVSWMPVNGDQCCPCAPCGPLKACQWSASVRGGAEWMWYPDRRRNDYTECSSIAILVVDDSGEGQEIDLELISGMQASTNTTPYFSDQFDLPWTVVGELGYALSCNTELFADFHYGRACGKSRSYQVPFDAIVFEEEELLSEQIWAFHEDYSDLKYFGGTIGMRHYCNGICGSCFYPFFGVKVGVRHFDPVRATVEGFIEGSDGEPQVIQDYYYYDSYNVLHGGFQFGITLKCGDCLNLFVMAEALGTCGLKPHQSGFVFVYANTTEVVDGDVVTTTEYENEVNVPPARTFNILSCAVTAGVQLTF